MRIVIVGAGGRRKTEASLARAARSLGHTVRVVNVVAWRRRLGGLGMGLAARRAEGFRPDAVIFTRHAVLLGEAAIRRLARGRGGGFWHFDFAAAPAAPVLDLARWAGTLYSTCLSQVELYRRLGAPVVRFLPQGVDPEADHPTASAPPAYHCDIAFIGSGQYHHRHELLRRLAQVGRLQIRGGFWEDADGLPVVGGPVHGRDFARVVRGAAISLGAHAVPEQVCERACASNRMWKVMGCGGFFLGPYMEGMEWFARGGEHCEWYRDVDEAVALARRYLADPAARAEVAAAGRAHALRHHTYARRIEVLLDGRSWE